MLIICIVNSPAWAKNDLLAYIPQDTLYVMGGFEPLPEKFLALADSPMFHTIMQTAVRAIQSDGSPDNAVRKLYSVYSKDMLDMGIQPLLAASGIDVSRNYVSYTVGLLAVTRMAVKDPNTFRQYLQTLEKRAGVSPQMRAIAGIHYRFYAVDDKPGGVGYVVAIHKDHVVLAVDVGDNPKRLIQAIGLKKPDRPLAINPLRSMVKRYRIKPYYFFYSRPKQIVKAVFGPDRQLFQYQQILSPQAGQNYAKIADVVAKSGCESDLLRMAENWPAVIMGHKTLSFDKKFTYDMVAGIDSRDTETLGYLKQLTGFLPRSLSDLNKDDVFSMGLGINMDQLIPVVSQWVQSVQKQTYQCAGLKGMQAALKKPNVLRPVAMLSGVTAGIGGMAVTLFQLQMREHAPKGQIQSVDLALYLNSGNPLNLASRMLAMIPQAAGQVPAKGKWTHFQVPLGETTNIPVNVTLTERDIQVNTGERSGKFMNGKTKQTTSRLFAMAFNMSRVIKLALRKPPKEFNEQQRIMLRTMADINLKMSMTMQAKKDRIVFDMNMTD